MTDITSIGPGNNELMVIIDMRQSSGELNVFRRDAHLIYCVVVAPRGKQTLITVDRSAMIQAS